jgi:hypothetical protein
VKTLQTVVVGPIIELFMHAHDWGWPRWDRQQKEDRQVCLVCGRSRRSLVQIHSPCNTDAPIESTGTTPETTTSEAQPSTLALVYTGSGGGGHVE